MKKILYVLLFVLVSGQVFAQYNGQTASYYFNQLGHNPAYAGSRDAFSISMTHRNQWVGIKGAPHTTFLNVHTPVKGKQLSVGVDLVYDEIAVTKTSSCFIDFAYYVQLDDKGNRLSFGLKGGFNVFDINLSELNADPDILGNDIHNDTRGNFGAGIYYYGAHHFVGISALSILRNSVLDNKNDIQLLPQMRRYYLTAGYVFTISPGLKLRPTVLVKAAKGESLVFDGELAALIKERLWLGLGYRDDVSLRGYFMADVTPWLSMGYNYEYIFNDLRKYDGGTHEFMLLFDINRNKLKETRYF